MKVMVSDTSVLIDLERGLLLETSLRLPFEFAVMAPCHQPALPPRKRLPPPVLHFEADGEDQITTKDPSSVPRAEDRGTDLSSVTIRAPCATASARR